MKKFSKKNRGVNVIFIPEDNTIDYEINYMSKTVFVPYATLAKFENNIPYLVFVLHQLMDNLGPDFKLLGEFDEGIIRIA